MKMKRALVIGTQVAGLAGVHNDIEAIGARLDARGFTLDVRTGHAASLEGIRTGLTRLIADTKPEDAALIYYSGHGARVRNPRHQPDGPELLHCLVPTDWHKPGFRGLLELELSLELAALTQKTANVTVILDCCHAARMWKAIEGEVTVRALDRLVVDGVGERLDELRSDARLALLHGESNPLAVRLVATEADRLAYEVPISFGGRVQRMGLLTANLCTLLDELGDARVSWRTLAMLVRERVMQRFDTQRPDLEGPGNRILFELDSAELGGGVVYMLDGQRPALRTSRLLGAEIGARHAIMPIGLGHFDPDKTVAEAEIIELTGTLAHVRLEPRKAMGESMGEPQIGALAFPIRAPLGKRTVRLRGEGSGLAALRELIASSRFVALAEADDVAFLELEGRADWLTLFAEGTAVTKPVQDNPATRQDMLAQLERRARAELLRNLADGGLAARVALEFGRVVDGQRISMHAGEQIHAEDRVYFEFGNLDARPLWFAVFDLGVDGTVTLLTSSGPSGIKLEPKQSYALGLELGDQRSGPGLLVSWPEAVPAEVPLPESLVVIIAVAPHDFTVLETGAARSLGASGVTELEQLLGQIGSGASRNIGRERAPATGAYRVVRLDFRTCAVPR